jgi:hypothetical protein
MADGRACRAGPQRDRPYCFSHDPERVEDAREARRLGGLRRRREGTLSLAYDLRSLDTVEGIRRILEIAVTDGLSLDNGVARVRLLISAASAAGRLLETADLEARLCALEEAARSVPRPPTTGSLLEEPPRLASGGRP